MYQYLTGPRPLQQVDRTGREDVRPAGARSLRAGARPGPARRDRATDRPISAASSSKSRSVHRWMLGVSYQAYGRSCEAGMRPPRARRVRRRQWPKLGNDTIDVAPDAHHLRAAPARGWCVACSVCDRITTSKRPVVELAEARVDVGLQHRHAARHAGVEAVGRDLDAVPLAAAGADQVLEQGAVAAAEVEHPRAAGHHGRHQVEVGTHRVSRRRPGPARPAPARRARRARPPPPSAA